MREGPGIVAKVMTESDSESRISSIIHTLRS